MKAMQSILLVGAVALSAACQTQTKSTAELLFPAGIHTWDKNQDARADPPSDSCAGCPSIEFSSPTTSELANSGWLYNLPDSSTTFNIRGLVRDLGGSDCGPNNDLFCSHEWRVWPPDASPSGANFNTPGGYLPASGDIDLSPSFQCGVSRLVIVAENTYGLTRAILDVNRAGGLCSQPEVIETSLAVRLNWGEANTDLDLHLVHEDGTFGDPVYDCYYDNCGPVDASGNYKNSMGTSNLDWGVAGSDLDNPLLDVDDQLKGGPENIFMYNPDSATYTIQVHYYKGIPEVFPEIEIWVDGELKQYVLYGELNPAFNEGSVWTAATFRVENGDILVTQVDTVGAAPQ